MEKISQGLRTVDLFAGAGGFSTGAAMAGANVIWAANHWKAACEVHEANHGIKPLCQDLQQADWTSVPAHDLLLASPSCQGHSRARGKDLPRHDAARSTAWAVVSALEVHRTQESRSTASGSSLSSPGPSPPFSFDSRKGPMSRWIRSFDGKSFWLHFSSLGRNSGLKLPILSLIAKALYVSFTTRAGLILLSMALLKDQIYTTAMARCISISKDGKNSLILRSLILV